MNEDNRRQGSNPPSQSNQGGDEPRHRGGQSGSDREQADDQGLRRKPDSESANPDSLGPDDRSKETDKHTQATMPPGEGQNPKRNTI